MATVKLEDIKANPVKSADSTLTVEMTGEKLSVGSHTFELQVQDDSGNVSAPARVTIIVVDTQAPTAVLELLDAQGRPADGNRIPFGASFILSGKKSVDVGGGSIARYTWTLL